MNTGPRLFSTLLVGALIAVFGSQAVASEARQLLPESEITAARIKAVFESALYDDVVIDEDNDVKVTEDGVIVFIRTESARNILTYLSLWSLKASASELEKLQMINRLNDELVFARFCMTKPTLLWCDWQLSYAGGISPYALVNNYREFRKVVVGAVSEHDPNDLIGSD